MPGQLEFEFHFGQSSTTHHSAHHQDEPMQILLMGDFGGHTNRGLTDHSTLQDRKVLAVDIERFDKVMCRIAPQLHLPIGVAGEPATKIEFFHLDDFHPDHLYERLSMFQALQQTRGQLQDPKTFPDTVKAFTQLAETVKSGVTSKPSHDTKANMNKDNQSLFEQLLSNQNEVSKAGNNPDANTQSGLSQFFSSIVTPHIVPEPDPSQLQFVNGIEQAISHQMRLLLHYPAFQQLESSWRSINQLIRKLDIGNRLQLYLLDVTKQEIAADLLQVDNDLSRSTLYRLLFDSSTASTSPPNWSLLLGDFAFTADVDDIKLLAALGAMGKKFGGPFLSAADTSLLGCESLLNSTDPRDWQPLSSDIEQRWQRLRRSAIAPWIGLALPRILLRLPYGLNTDEIEHFPFEEMTALREHESYLWGNPAYACAYLIGQSFLTHDWKMSLGDKLYLDDLPAHIYKDGDETHLQACSEVYLSDHTAEAILTKGIMPWLSYKNRNAIHLLRFQSIAEPPSALLGPWLE